jgi:hypothetical protein
VKRGGVEKWKSDGQLFFPFAERGTQQEKNATPLAMRAWMPTILNELLVTSNTHQHRGGARDYFYVVRRVTRGREVSARYAPRYEAVAVDSRQRGLVEAHSYKIV